MESNLFLQGQETLKRYQLSLSEQEAPVDEETKAAVEAARSEAGETLIAHLERTFKPLFETKAVDINPESVAMHQVLAGGLSMAIAELKRLREPVDLERS